MGTGTNVSYLALIVLFPLLGALFNGLLGKHVRPQRRVGGRFGRHFGVVHHPVFTPSIRCGRT